MGGGEAKYMASFLVGKGKAGVSDDVGMGG
jgi:hypothetical protein